MNRRHFLGLALSSVVLPAAAKTRRIEPRILTLHHLHTDDKIEVAYRIGDYYQRDSLKKLNKFLQDFRTGEEIFIDPRLFDLLYDIKGRLGYADGCFEILSAYRSPSTNTMLRKTSRRVARKSLHMSGKALDIRFASESSKKVRDCALALRRGGVGFYAASDFVHVDTGSVRRWGA